MLRLESAREPLGRSHVSRRGILQAGTLGLGALTLPRLLELQAQGATTARDKSVILVWLDGGPSQLESYDPKPDAPVECRGPFGAISSQVPGIQLCELVPEQAKIADKLAFIRSVHHGNGDHFAGAHWMLTGRFGATSASPTIRFPSLGATVSRVCGPRRPGLPAYVGLPSAESVYLFPGYHGAAYLGGAYNPFDVDTQSRYLHHSYNVKVEAPKCFSQSASVDTQRLSERGNLLQSLDTLRRQADNKAAMDTYDRFQQQAISLVTSSQATQAFDVTQESAATIERYGDNPWGRYTLMARRLVEAGVRFVTVDMPHWDHHSSLVKGHAPNMLAMDRAVAALVGELAERNMLDDVLVLVMGEFGRTPRINNGLPNDPVPGRDHWGDAISVMMAGGGLKGGVVVGATNSRAEYPVERPLDPQDILATVYRVLGVDLNLSFPDHAGRPIPLVSVGKPIGELF
jgi:uncharacterized protein (DUF1501 family)